MIGDRSGDLGDLVTLAQYIPDGVIEGIIDVFDEFEMKQIFARAKGMKVGDLIDYKYCQYIGEPSIEQLLGTINSNCTEEDLEEIRKKYEKLKQSQGVEQKIDRLKFRKQSIISRQDSMKKGIPIFVSCKMTNPKPDALNEIYALANSFGGYGAIPVLATSSDVCNRSRTLWGRSKEMGVEVLDCHSLNREKMKEFFKRL
jgi:hypothetical protein